MNRIPSLLASLAVPAMMALPLAAAVPAPDQLLPEDTFVVLAVPDWAAVEASRPHTPVLRLWNDPAMKPFRDKLMTKLTKDVVEPLERELGIKCDDYSGVVRGQFTVALTQSGWTGSWDPPPGLLVLVDSKDKADVLRKNLADLRKKLTDSGKKIRTEKSRDLEVTTVPVDLDELGTTFSKILPAGLGGGLAGGKDKPDPAPDADKGAKRTVEVSFAQADSLLVAATKPKDLDKVLARLAGASAPCLGEQPAYRSDHAAYFREAMSFGWVNVAPLMEVLIKVAAEGAKDNNPMAPTPERLLTAFGLGSLKTLAFAGRQGPEGGKVDAFMGVPEEKRKGFFKLLALEPKEAGAPPFVPADTVQFSRWRLDGQKFWAGLEAMLNDISPGMVGLMIGQIDGVMKEKDPNFEFRRSIVGNLGDDVIMYQKAPRGSTLAELNSPPSLVLLGSSNAEQLLQALRTIAAVLPGPFSGGEFKEREFQGRKIYSIALPEMPQPGSDKPKAQTLNVAASGGYVAFTTDPAMIEGYLRSGDSKPKPLQEVPGLSEAAQKVGGTGSGMFGYQNDLENLRAPYEALRKNPDLFAKTFEFFPVPARAKIEDSSGGLKDWVDFSLLPPFESVAKYVYMTLYSGRTTAEGFGLKAFSPKPPQLNQ